MNIRKATIEDLGSIQRLNLMLFEHDFQFDKTLDLNWTFSSDGVKSLTESIESENFITIVAEEEDVIVGYMVAGLEATPDYMKNDIKIAELQHTFIDENHRRSGIGTKMYEEIVKWAKVKGANMMKVVASYDNHFAHNFYQKRGLKPSDITFQSEI